MPRDMLILHSGSAGSTRADEADTLVQAGEVSALLAALGWQVETLSYELGEAAVGRAVQALEPQLVFNLVESAYGSDAQCYRATQLLDQLRVAYTGAPTHAMRFCASKPRLKRVLADAAIPTPAWAAGGDGKASPLPAGRYIVKSETEHGSLGLDAASVVDAAQVWFAITQSANRHGGAWFAEQYIDGREFNLALLADGPQVKVLPLAEISFAKMPENRPKIVDYAAKWDEKSISFHATERVFAAVPELSSRLAELGLRCWDACGLKGYARIDFRVDSAGNPYVIDVNPNPCLSSDAGFLAATAQAGLSPQQVMQRIVDDALHSAPARKHPAPLLG